MTLSYILAPALPLADDLAVGSCVVLCLLIVVDALHPQSVSYVDAGEILRWGPSERGDGMDAQTSRASFLPRSRYVFAHITDRATPSKLASCHRRCSISYNFHLEAAVYS